MLKLGIIGYPLDHTLSPVMHNAALQYLNISGEYKAYEVKENELEETTKKLKELGLRGFNVTIPYKTKIIPLVDKLTATAKLINAVNTVTILEAEKTIGDNTDVTGFWEAIPTNTRQMLSTSTASIIGYGGSAAAAAVACIQNNVKLINIYGRDKKKLSDFKNFLDNIIKISRYSTSVSINTLNNINLSNTFMLVNTTPVGMFPNINTSPITREDLKKLPSNALVYDLIYNPKETKLLKDAKSLGLQTLNGIEMLIRQGAEALKIWLGQDIAPLGVMRLAVAQSLELVS